MSDDESSVERTDRYNRVKLPDAISTMDDAATCGLALTEYFDSESGYQDDTLANLANVIQSVCRARWQTRGPNLDEQTRYGSRVTFIDGDGEAHTALVMEPEVASMNADEAYDPYQDKMVDPKSEYPLGTVQLIYTPDYNLSEGFNFDRKSDIEVATSVAPASGPDAKYAYYAGWDYALENGETST